MEIFKILNANKKELDKILSIDEISRLSITIKDSSVFGKDGFQYVILEGPEERLKVAKESLKTISEKIEKEEEMKVRDLIEKEREDVYSGLGSIFG